MTPAERRNLVVGAAIGYAVPQVMPFLRSLRHSGYEGDIALVVHQALAGALLTAAPVQGLILRRAAQWLPLRLRMFARGRRPLLGLWAIPRALLWVLLRFARRLPGGRVAHLRERLLCILHPPHHSRFLHYRRIVRETACTHVLLSDVRDVIFQADPFRCLPERGLAVSVESRRYNLSGEVHNAEWLRRAYGEHVIRQIGDRPVSCSGVTYGDRAAILRYLDAMCEAIAELPFRATDRPLDQAPHNALIWRGLLGDVALLETLDSAVATLHGLSLEDLRFDAHGRVVNRDGSAVCVLHMYDRVPGLKERILAVAGAA